MGCTNSFEEPIKIQSIKKDGVPYLRDSRKVKRRTPSKKKEIKPAHSNLINLNNDTLKLHQNLDIKVNNIGQIKDEDYLKTDLDNENEKKGKAILIDVEKYIQMVEKIEEERKKRSKK